MTEKMHCMEIWDGNRAVRQHFQMPGLKVWLYSRPHDAAAAGGDVYYLSSCASGRISRWLLADVSGHGASVSELAVRLKDLMRGHVNTISQAGVVEGVNREFAEFSRHGTFVTALVGTFFSATGSFQLCVAGHPSPLVYRKPIGAWSVLEAGEGDARRNIPLGILDRQAFQQCDFRLDPGDMVLAYTDGATEVPVETGRHLETEGLLEIVRTFDAGNPGRIIEELPGILSSRAGAPLGDDLSLLLAQVDGSGVSLADNLFSPFRLLGPVRDAVRFRNTV